MKRDILFATVLDQIHTAFPNVKAVYVYGSFAKKLENNDSDLDIALLLDKPGDSIKLWEVSEQIAARIQRNVDLCDLLTVSTVFRFQIISSGIRIDTRDLKTCDFFEDLTYKSYIRLNEQRKDILNDIKNRGSIY